MQDIYFDPSFGNRPQDLVGRATYLREFEAALSTRPGNRARSILILGQRGYGKTVLLLEMADIASRNGYIVASPTVTSKEMPERILEKLHHSSEEFLKKEKTEITGGSINILGFGAGIQVQSKESGTTSFAFRLSELCNKLGEEGHGVMLLIDEVQANSEELKQVIIAYQEIVGEGGDIAIVMAGLPGAISSTLNDKVLTFLNRAKKMNLEPININDVYGYFRNTFKKSKIKISDDDCRAAALFTAGSPYLMQLVGHYITIYSDDKGLLTKKYYAAAMEDAKKDFINDIGKITLHALSEKDIEFLQAMVMDNDMSSISDVAERMNVSSAYAQLYKRRLIDSGIIEQPRRGKVRFAVAYLRDYLMSLC